MGSAVQNRMSSIDTNNSGCKRIEGSFTVGAAGAVATQTGKGVVVTKVAAQAGRYLITFDRKYLKYVTGGMSVSQAAGVAQLSGHLFSIAALKSAGTITIELRINAGTATDAASGDRVSYEFTLDNTGLV